MSAMLEALRQMYEPTLVCRCTAANSPSLRVIHILTEREAACDQCGLSGPIDLFTPKEK